MEEELGIRHPSQLEKIPEKQLVVANKQPRNQRIPDLISSLMLSEDMVTSYR